MSGGRGCRGPGREEGSQTAVAATTAAAAVQPLTLHVDRRTGLPVARLASRPVAHTQQRVCGRDVAPQTSTGAARKGKSARTTRSSAPVRSPDIVQHLLSQFVMQSSSTSDHGPQLLLIYNFSFFRSKQGKIIQQNINLVTIPRKILKKAVKVLIV